MTIADRHDRCLSAARLPPAGRAAKALRRREVAAPGYWFVAEPRLQAPRGRNLSFLYLFFIGLVISRRFSFQSAAGRVRRRRPARRLFAELAGARLARRDGECLRQAENASAQHVLIINTTTLLPPRRLLETQDVPTLPAVRKRGGPRVASREWKTKRAHLRPGRNGGNLGRRGNGRVGAAPHEPDRDATENSEAPA